MRRIVRSWKMSERVKIRGNKDKQAIHRQLRELNEKEELKRMNHDIATTRGSFNSFTSYLWLFRKPVLGIMLLALTVYTGWKYLRIGHLKKVDNTIKWDPISEDQERKIQQSLLKIFANNLEEKKYPNSHSITKKVQRVCQNFNKSFVFVKSIEPIIIILPTTVILSNKIASEMDEKELYVLVGLFSILFHQRYHIKELSLLEIPTFIYPNQISSELKLKKIYARQYSKSEIINGVQLLQKQKNVNPEEALNVIKKATAMENKSSFSIKKRLPSQYHEGGFVL